MVDVKDWNVVILGLSFMFIFTAFQTTSLIEESILNSAKNESTIKFEASGYSSLCIIYGSVTLFIWFAPPIITFIGSKFAMILGGFCLAWVFIFSLYFVSKFVDTDLQGLLYAASVVSGFGGAVIWPAQGVCLTINSTDETMGRNSGIFWVFLQFSFLIGSMIVYFCFKRTKASRLISLDQRSTVLYIFMALSAFGTLFFLLLRNVKTREREVVVDSESLIVDIQNSSGERIETRSSPLESLISSVKLFFTKPMFYLNMTFIYTGLELSFYSGVYGTIVGNTLSFHDSKQLIGLSGVFIGLGEIVGGGLLGILGKRITAKGRDSVVLLGMLVHFTAFFLILLNFPEKSPNNESNGVGYLFNPSVPVAMLCAFMLGFGDSCFQTQIVSLLGNFYSDNSASAFANYNFSQCAASAVGFFYSSSLDLRDQLIILFLGACCGTLGFFHVERMAKAKARARASSNSSDA